MEPQVRPLLGRDGELATVDAWLTRVPAAGNAALLVIAGEPGIGKTTLWGEATRRAGENSAAAMADGQQGPVWRIVGNRS